MRIVERRVSRTATHRKAWTCCCIGADAACQFCRLSAKPMQPPGQVCRVESVTVEATVEVRTTPAPEGSNGRLESGNTAQAADGKLENESEAQPADPAALLQRLKPCLATLQTGLFERETEVRLLLLAALAGEHVLFLGPPGTAKSVLGRRLASLCAGPFFERLLTRFSVPEELFGPLSLRGLEEDRYVRQTEGYLPTAAVAFVDEIFKANSAILNTLLTVLNERLFDNGTSRVPIPLICLVGASNELPESEELDALYDRFLLRRQVQRVSHEAVPALLKAVALKGKASGGVGACAQQKVADEASFSQGELDELRRTAHRDTAVPEDVIFLVTDLRDHLENKCKPPFVFSDRRLTQSLQFLQVAAYTSGRQCVSKLDCLLLQHILWDKPEQAEKVRAWLSPRVLHDAGVLQLDNLVQGLYERTHKRVCEGASDSGLFGDVSKVRLTVEEGLQTTGGVLYKPEKFHDSSKESLWLSASEVEAALQDSTSHATRQADRGALAAMQRDLITLQNVLQQQLVVTTSQQMAAVLPKRHQTFTERRRKP